MDSDDLIDKDSNQGLDYDSDKLYEIRRKN